MTLQNKFISIGHRKIGADYPVYVVAELSANHHHSLQSALRLIEEAKKAGADAVKIQTYTADTITINCKNKYFRIGGGTIWDGKSLYDLYRDAFTPWEWHEKLQKKAYALGLDFFSSPFDTTAVTFLESMNISAYKVASFELVDIPLIETIAETKKPIIFSTGMATKEEIWDALSTAKHCGARQIALLKCTSAYPAPPQEMNLKTLCDMAKTFQVPVGLSDHTLGITASITAVTLGACIVEKHLTLSRKTPGPDSSFSLEPQEFKAMVDGVRTAQAAIGKVSYGPSAHEKASCSFRRSLFAVKDILKGERLTDQNVRSIRPAHGLAPKYLKKVLGKKSRTKINFGTPIQWKHI